MNLQAATVFGYRNKINHYLKILMDQDFFIVFLVISWLSCQKRWQALTET